MPSDCQCSSACTCKTIERFKVISNKEATERIKRLEEEVERLTKENKILRSENRKETINKKELIKKLKSHLDNV